MLFGMSSLSPAALLCPTWDPNSTEIPSVLANQLRLLLCPIILANCADGFGFICTLCISQPAAEMGCSHLLASHLSGLPVCAPGSQPPLSPASNISNSAAAQTDRLTPFASSPSFSQLLSLFSFPVLTCEIPLMGRNKPARPSC